MPPTGVDRSGTADVGRRYEGTSGEGVTHGRLLTTVRSPGPGPPIERLSRFSTYEPRRSAPKWTIGEGAVSVRSPSVLPRSRVQGAGGALSAISTLGSASGIWRL